MGLTLLSEGLTSFLGITAAYFYSVLDGSLLLLHPSPTDSRNTGAKMVHICRAAVVDKGLGLECRRLREKK